MKKAQAALIFCFCIVFLYQPVTTSTLEKAGPSFASQVLEVLQKEVPKWIEEQNIPGAAVAVVDAKNILWTHVDGNTRREGGRLINPETLFSIQSMSKSFTALGVLMAVQEGLLDLDTPITDYLPDFSVNSSFEESPERKITLRHLLAHRAGFTHEAPLGGNFDDRPHSFNEHILSISDSWLCYPVGYRFSYSNLGIDLAGYILQEKTGLPFWEYIRIKVFEPLGMDQSTLDFDKIKQHKNRATGHISPDQKIDGEVPVYIPMIPAGGVYTNILDMADYLRFHINKGEVDGRQILKRELMDEMHAVAFPEKYQRTGYGLGITRNIVSKTYYLQHGGGGYGFITSMCIYPELKIGVVTLTNTVESRFTGSRIVEIINSMAEKEMGATEPWPEKPTIDTALPLKNTDERVNGLLGIYELGIPLAYKDGVLGIRVNREFYALEFYLDQQELIGFFGKYSELRIKPPVNNRKSTLIHLNRYNGTCRCYDFHKPERSLDPEGPDKPEWKRYKGRYQMLIWGRSPTASLWITTANGYLTVNGGRCREHLPGLFFTYNGEALDFRGTIPTFRNIMLYKKK